MSETIDLIEQIIRERSALIGKLQREVDGLELALGILKEDEELGAKHNIERDGYSPVKVIADKRFIYVKAKLEPAVEKPVETVAAKPDEINDPQDAAANAVLAVFVEMGVHENWVKVTYETLREATGFNDPTLRRSMQRLEEAGKVKVVRVTSGEGRGNWFTTTDLPFKQPVGDAPREAPVKTSAPKAAHQDKPQSAPETSDLADEILGYLSGIAAKIGVPAFQLPFDRIQSANKCNFQQMVGALDLLANEGHLVFKRHSDGKSYNFTLKEGA